MDIDRVMAAIDSIDRARDEAARRRDLITRANGSHIYIEGSTHGSKSPVEKDPQEVQQFL